MTPEKISKNLIRIADAIDNSQNPNPQLVAQDLLIVIESISDGPSLQHLLALLQAEDIIHQMHHWKTTGPNSYSDHLLFQRLYEDTEGFIDSTAEKIIGLGGEIDSVLHTKFLSEILSSYSTADEAEELVACSLSLVKRVIECISEVKNHYEQCGCLTDGLDNFLQGVADKHEEFVYLLQQRSEK